MMRSHLLFDKFLPVKSSNFSGNPCNLQSHVTVKDFPMQTSYRVQAGHADSPH